MNMQALMKQAQNLQRDMLNTKNEIDNMSFEGNNNLVNVVVNGKKQVLSIKIDNSNLDFDDIDVLQDMILLAMNDALSKVDKTTEEKMGKYSNIPGLF